VTAGIVYFIFAPHPEKQDDVVFVENITGGKSYRSGYFGFDTGLPPGFIVNESYVNRTLGSGREIPGVSFTVPESFTQGTNLSPDSYVAVERQQGVICEPSSFMLAQVPVEDVIIGTNAFKRATSVSAAAGNMYEDVVSVFERGGYCYAVRYLIHTTQLANYPAGAVREYDRERLLQWFDSVAASLMIR
jgi:hypothetical protein